MAKIFYRLRDVKLEICELLKSNGYVEDNSVEKYIIV
jgi:hypothetical protein